MKRDKPLFELDDRHRDGGACPLCQSSLQLKHIGSSSFWGCSAYPQCKYTRSLHEEAEFIPEPLPDVFCPRCEAPLLLKKGRYGFFIGCSEFPQCDYISDPEPDSAAGLAQCPACKKGELVERTSKFGKAFYACNRYPTCKYAVNHRPVASSCPECGFELLVEKESASGTRRVCPQKACSYKSNPV